MNRPALRTVPLCEVLPIGLRPGEALITMTTGQPWDLLLDAAYRDGWTVLELDHDEQPVRAYRKPGAVLEGRAS